MGKHYINTVGTNVIVDTGTDISGATNLLLKVKKPNATLVEWTPTIYNNNYLKYVIIADDWDMDGDYWLQSSFTIGTWTGLGESVTFHIYNVYE